MAEDMTIAEKTIKLEYSNALTGTKTEFVGEFEDADMLKVAKKQEL